MKKNFSKKPRPARGGVHAGKNLATILNVPDISLVQKDLCHVLLTFLLSMICTFLNVFEHCGTNVRLKRGDGFGADVTQVKLLLMRMRLAFGKLIVCPPPLSLLHSFPLQSFAKSELIPLENGSFSV